MGLELSGSAPSVQFENVGDTVRGKVVRVEQMQQTNMETGELVFWDAARVRPKMMIAVTLHAPGHKDAGDDGQVVLYLSGGRYSAVKEVTNRIDEDADLGMTFSAWSDQAPKQRGFGRAKRYTATYQPPARGARLDDTAPRQPSRQDGQWRPNWQDDEPPF